MTDGDIERVLLSAEEIRGRVAEMAAQIEADREGGEIAAVGILTGAFVFLADLVRNFTVPTRITFAYATSYREGSRPGGLDLDFLGVPEFAGRDVLLVEDIVDTGHTLAGLRQSMEDMGASAVRVAALLDKPSRREVDVEVDYTGVSVPDEFLVGYGLDYAGRYRYLPYVGVLKKSVYEGGA
jgi:hypoxanthine phosphoribosyltransferase